jgi:hypothetical protein
VKKDKLFHYRGNGVLEAPLGSGYHLNLKHPPPKKKAFTVYF